MKINKLFVSVSALAIVGCALTSSERMEKESLEDLVNKSNLIEITNTQINALSKKDSLQLLDSRYNVNEQDLAKFNLWIDSTINESKLNNSYAIIVNKSDYKLFLYKDGVKQTEVPIELGFNPYDDKKMQGDYATPEGMYKITKKNNSSNYYKSLIIDYPNSTDLKEFSDLKNNNLIPLTAKIGNDIAIHGHGSGKRGIDGGYNWTHGCIAGYDFDIDKIFRVVPKGTRVTIVKFSDRNL